MKRMSRRFEHGLNKAVNKLREALGDDPSNPRYIETVPRRGYRFIFPIVPEEPRREEKPRKKRPSGRWILLSVVALLLTAAFLFIVNAGGVRAKLSSGSAPQPQIHSLAVLPLISLSGDQGQGYFTEGMTEALITELGKISALRVISHQSVMQYKGTNKSVPQIARELNVDAIVEGSIIRAGDQVRISVQLIDGRTDRHLWADNYQRELRSILSLQDDVAKAIAAQVKVTVAPEEQQLLASAIPLSPDAHEAYLKGRYYVNRWPEAESEHCTEAFQQAIGKEPNFADAYSGLATCYSAMPWTHDPNDVLPRAKKAAQQALTLDPNQAEAYAALGAVNMFYEWDWPAAERNFRKAIELNPNRAFSHMAYSNYFAFTGRADDAIREGKTAVELDPVSILMNRSLAFAYQLAHKFPEYEAQARATLELAPTSTIAKWDVAWALALQGKKNEALAQLDDSIDIIDKAIVFATVGEREKALRGLKQVEKERPLCSFCLAQPYALAGESNEAIRLIEKSYPQHDAMLVQLKTNPAFDSLHSDPRYQVLLRRIHLSP